MNSSIPKLFFRILAIIGISLLSLLVLLYVFVQLPIGRNVLKNILEDTLSGTLQYEVSVGQIQTNVVSGISVYDISLKDSVAVSSSVGIGSIMIHYNIFALLSRTVSISEILIRELDVQLVRNSEGELLLPKIAQKTNLSKKPMRVLLGKIEVIKSAISYDDLSIPLEAQVQGFMLTLKNDVSASQYDLNARFQSGELTYNNQKYEIDNFLVQGSFAHNKMEISDISFSSKGLNCSGLAEAHFTESDTTMHAHLAIYGDPTQYLQMFENPFSDKLQPQVDSISIKASLKGNLSQPYITATVTIPHIHAKEISLYNTVIMAVYNNDSLSINKMEAEVFDGSLYANGWISLDGSEIYQVRMNISDVAYSKLWDFLYENRSPYTGSLNGSLNSSGSITSFTTSHLAGQVQLTSIRYKEKNINPLHCTFSYQEGNAELEVLQGTSSVTGNFVLRDSELNGSASVNIKNIEHLAGLFNLPGVKGTVYADAEFEGALDDPTIQAHVKGSDLSYKNIPVDSIFADVHYADSILFIEKSAFRGNLESLSSLNSIIPDKHLTGRVEYKGTLTGSLEDFAGTFNIQADSVCYEDYSVPSLTLECHAENADVTIDHLNIKTKKASCKAQGDVSVTEKKGNFIFDFYAGKKEHKHAGSLQGRIEFADSVFFETQLKEISLALFGAISDSLAGTQGQISGDILFHGDKHYPGGLIELTIDNPSYKDFSVDAVFLQGNLQPDRFILNDGLITVLKNDIQFKGKLDFDRSAGTLAINQRSRIQGEILLNDVVLENLAQEFLSEVNARGTLSSSMNISGTIGKPHLDGFLRINNGFLQLDSHKSPIEKFNMFIALSDSTMTINKCTGLYEGNSFSLKGRISSQDWQSFTPDIEFDINGRQAITLQGSYKPEEVDLRLVADTFDVSFIEVVPAIMNAKGYVNAYLNVKGSPRNPHLDGWLRASNIDILPQSLSTPLTKCVLDITATNERLDLKTCKCNFGEGKISGSGFISYKNSTIDDIVLKLNATNISLKKPKKYQLYVKTCDLNYTQQRTGYEIDGTIILGKTKYLEDVQISKLIESIGKPKIFKKPSPIMTQTKLNIRLTESKDLWIENNLAKIKMRADINVVGTLAQPNIAGRLEITDGYIVYIDRKFDITVGTFDFTDPNMINPILDIQAETDVKNYIEPDSEPYHITLLITGAVDKAVVTIQSVPVLDEANILSLLTFGTTRDHIFSQTPDKYDTSLKDILLERAEQYSSQMISGFVAGKIEQIFDLDDVSIEGNLFKFGDSWGPQLVASKQLSKRMKVTYSTRVGYMNEQSIELDYKLTDHLYLQGQADQDGTSGMDVIYRLNFK